MSHFFMPTKKKVLFLCSANSARSLMGEAILRHLSADQFEVFSAGKEPDRPQALALQALEAHGVNTSGLASKSIEALAEHYFDTVFILCEKALQACHHWKGGCGQLFYWDISDPRLHGQLDAYEHTFNDIYQRLSLWLLIEARDDIRR
ncbi:arsenate reductase ArsC [Halomonas sp. SpR1]|uniref:arsenate reductase ArsC n=1 Tax=Halomonas sp. SpR1 TaxID=3050462 RepID=UPI0027E49C5B|nr:arsenate reductase ArsC [Halomonas sp. SpR1]